VDRLLSLKDRIYTSSAIKASPGSKVVVAGWVHRLRVVGKICFVILRDREGLIQVVVKRDKSPQMFDEASQLKQEDVIAVKGEIVPSKASIGGVDLVAEELVVLSKTIVPLPIFPDDWEKTSLAKRLDWRFLDLRSPRNLLIFRVQDTLENAMRYFYRENGFTEIHTSKLVAEATEGGAEVFPVIYFDKTAFLAQSPQLYKQMMVIAGFEKVFESGPAYRAEKHHTPRHLTEYQSIDIEMGFIEGPEDVMDMVEKATLRALSEVASSYSKLVKELLYVDINLPKEVIKIKLTDACRLIESTPTPCPSNYDISTEHEKAIGEAVANEYGTDLFFITEYPWIARPFYTMKSDDNPKFTRSFDLIYKGVEIVSGSQREHRYSKLVEQMTEKGLRPEKFAFYLEMFKYGAPPHGGAGLGLERLTMTTLGLKNIREARLLPRDPERLTP
jgi:nondiscriminating aspartyl-tRNA synthetase